MSPIDAADHEPHGAAHRGHAHVDAHVVAEGSLKDPVCGMSVDPASAQHSARIRRANVFLLLRRMPRQIRSPSRSAMSPERPPRRRSARRPATVYTCPMHPEVRQTGPGVCPICGMALEPESAERRGGAESGTARHDAPLLVRPRRSPRRSSRSRWAGISSGLRWLSSAGVQLGATGAGDAGRPVGGLAVLRARARVDPESEASTCSR